MAPRLYLNLKDPDTFFHRPTGTHRDPMFFAEFWRDFWEWAWDNPGGYLICDIGLYCPLFEWGYLSKKTFYSNGRGYRFEPDLYESLFQKFAGRLQYLINREGFDFELARTGRRFTVAPEKGKYD